MLARGTSCKEQATNESNAVQTIPDPVPNALVVPMYLGHEGDTIAFNAAFSDTLGRKHLRLRFLGA